MWIRYSKAGDWHYVRNIDDEKLACERGRNAAFAPFKAEDKPHEAICTACAVIFQREVQPRLDAAWLVREVGFQSRWRISDEDIAQETQGMSTHEVIAWGVNQDSSK